MSSKIHLTVLKPYETILECTCCGHEHIFDIEIEVSERERLAEIRGAKRAIMHDQNCENSGRGTCYCYDRYIAELQQERGEVK